MSEVRLIDANALKEAVKNHFDMLDAYFPNTFIEEIDNAPTVEVTDYEQKIEGSRK